MKSSTAHDDDNTSKHSSALSSLHRRGHETPQHDDDGEIREAFQEMVSSDLTTLTAQERSEALDDIHCVGIESQETTEMMGRLLADFDRLVQQEHLYALTVRQIRIYVDDPSFRMRFLRCNRYNVEQSVHQMMAFLQHKAAYFGEEKVASEITLADLNEEEKGLLLSGVYHIQKENDRAGRLVVHVMTHMLERWRIETLVSRMDNCSMRSSKLGFSQNSLPFQLVDPHCSLYSELGNAISPNRPVAWSGGSTLS